MFYDLEKWVMWADSPQEDGKRARLILSFRDGNPRFMVYTGGQGKDAMINFPMDMPHLASIMIAMQEIAEGPNDTQIKIDSLTTVYENNKPTNQKKVVSVLVVGKSKDGLVYLCVIADTKPKIVFPFKPSVYHVWRNGAGEVIADSVLSVKMAKGMAKAVASVIGRIMVDYTNETYESGTRKSVPIKTSEGGTKPVGKQPEFTDIDDIF